MAKLIQIKNEVLIRVYIVGFLIALIALIVIGQAVKIQLVEGEKWRTMRDSMNIREIAVEAERGNIFADDGSILATSLPFFDIRFDPTEASDDLFYDNIDSLAVCLAQINPEFTTGGWLQHLTDKRLAGRKYLKIKERVSHAEMERIKSFPVFNKGRFGGGFIAEERFRRYRPFTPLAGRTLGYVSDDNQNQVGIEGFYNHLLAGESGKRLMYSLGQGNWMPLSNLTEIEPQKGLDIMTTLDVNMQDVTHRALYEAVKKYDAKYGTAIVMEVKTGAIKAISNLGKYGDGWSEGWNYAIGTRYEPGSTYKLASIMALMEDGYVELEDLVEIDSGQYQFYEEKMEDSGRESFVTDTTTVRRAFEISSNVGIAKLVHQFYNKNERTAKKYINRLKSFYLHLPTGINLKGEAAPYLKEPYSEKDLWSGTTIPWMSIGYETEITPLQLLAFFNAVANDGVMMKPYLVSEVREEGEQVERFPPMVLKRRLASKKTIQNAQELLKGVVERGTAQKLQSSRYTFAGKTGTSQINYHRLKSRSELGHVASFAGYFPADNPVYSCIVVVSDPQVGSYYGAEVAGPVFRQIADKCYELEPAFYNPINENAKPLLASGELPRQDLGYQQDFSAVFQQLDIPFQDNQQGQPWTVTYPKNDSLFLVARTIPPKKVPSVIGMGLRDALFLLENNGLQVEVDGVGKVVRQSIIPGTRIRGQKIKLFLR